MTLRPMFIVSFLVVTKFSAAAPAHVCVDVSHLNIFQSKEVGRNWLLLKEAFLNKQKKAVEGIFDKTYSLLNTQEMKVLDVTVPFTNWVEKLRPKLIESKASFKNSAGEEYSTWSPRLIYVSSALDTLGFMIENMGAGSDNSISHFLAFYKIKSGELIFSKTFQTYKSDDYSWWTVYLGVDTKDKLYLSRDNRVSSVGSNVSTVNTEVFRISPEDGSLSLVSNWPTGPFNDSSLSSRGAGITSQDLLFVAEYSEKKDAKLKLRLIDAESGSIKVTLPLPPASFVPAVSQDLKRIYLPSAVLKSITVVDLESKNELMKIGIGGAVHAVQLFENGEKIAALVRKHKSSVDIFSTKNGKLLASLDKKSIFETSLDGDMDVTMGQTPTIGKLIVSFLDKTGLRALKMCRLELGK